ncbi:hypothetical protein LIA77_01389 [Sarocladium implicatum]|nr:hypothetical protein LIA77_01389 [Sarocladium implicatum]
MRPALSSAATLPRVVVCFITRTSSIVHHTSTRSRVGHGPGPHRAESPSSRARGLTQGRCPIPLSIDDKQLALAKGLVFETNILIRTPVLCGFAYTY